MAFTLPIWIFRINGLKYAYYAKSGEPTNCGYFVCNPVMDLEATQYQSMSITMDPNYFPAITYSKFDPYVSNYGVSLFTARPKAAYGGGAWGSCEGDPFSKWRCEPVFVADDNTEAGGWAAIDISSSNLGRIVYVDFDRMGGNLGLAYLRQEGYMLALPVIRK